MPFFLVVLVLIFEDLFLNTIRIFTANSLSRRKLARTWSLFLFSRLSVSLLPVSKSTHSAVKSGYWQQGANEVKYFQLNLSTLIQALFYSTVLRLFFSAPLSRRSKLNNSGQIIIWLCLKQEFDLFFCFWIPNEWY